MTSATDTHDYTKDAPFDENPDDFLIGSDVTASDKSVDQIESENTFTTPDPGDHVFVVKEFLELPKPTLVTVTLRGQLTTFEGFALKVRLALAGNPRCSITDFFLLPPNDPRELPAYYKGVPEGKKQAGWAAAKFVQFINRLGYNFPPGGKLPQEALRIGNWKGREVIATVEAGKGTYTDPQTGEQKPRGPQVKVFTYRLAESTILGKDPGSSGRAGPTGPAPAAATRFGHAGPAPAVTFAGSGLDNV